MWMMESNNSNNSSFSTGLIHKKNLYPTVDDDHRQYTSNDSCHPYGDIEHNFSSLHLRKQQQQQNQTSTYLSTSERSISWSARQVRIDSFSQGDSSSTCEPTNCTDFSMESILKSSQSVNHWETGHTLIPDPSSRSNSFSHMNGDFSIQRRNSHSICAQNSYKSTPFYHRQMPRSRTFYDPDKLTLLESAFNENPYAQKSTRMYIASALNITENQVKVWFQNRRSKRKHVKSAITKSTNNDTDNPTQTKNS